MGTATPDIPREIEKSIEEDEIDVDNALKNVKVTRFNPLDSEENQNEDINKMIFQQKRLILQKFIDGDKGVEVFHNTNEKPSYKFYISIDSS